MQRGSSSRGIVCLTVLAAAAIPATAAIVASTTSEASTASAATADGAPFASTVLDLRFDGPSGTVIKGSNIVNSGTAATTHAVLTRGTAVPSQPFRRPRASFRPGVDAAAATAARLPGWVAPDQDPPLAIVAVSVDPSITDPAADPLNPATGAFSWRADFLLDADAMSSSVDGDNLFQRGLSPDVLWKLEVDRGRVDCVVRAANVASGAITQTVTPSVQVTPGTWYRAACTRTAQATLTLTVEQYAGGAWQPAGTTTAPTKARGTLAMPPATPVSIGGKLRNATTIVPAGQNPSQFNGLVDNVALTIG